MNQLYHSQRVTGRGRAVASAESQILYLFFAAVGAGDTALLFNFFAGEGFEELHEMRFAR